MKIIEETPLYSPGLNSNPWKVLYHKKEIQKLKNQALQNFLTMHCLSKGIVVHNHKFIPDQDRVVINQALVCKLPNKFIKLLLEDYPNACLSGGVVDHINHPIHVACRGHREAVRCLLEAYPESANQLDENGKLPFQVFIENKDTIDISSEIFIATTNLFYLLSPRSRDVISNSRESLKDQLITDCILPSHLHPKNDVDSTFVTHACDEEEFSG